MTRRGFLAGCAILPGQVREDCAFVPPVHDAEGNWTGWPRNPRVSGWHRLETSFVPDERWWWDAGTGVWKGHPDAFSALDHAPGEMAKDHGARYLGPD